MKITIAENYERKNSRSLNYYCFIHSLIDASTTMEENIYMLTDGEIRRRLGQKIRQLRLRQNFTQVSLAEQAQVSLTTLKKSKKGAQAEMSVHN